MSRADQSNREQDIALRLRKLREGGAPLSNAAHRVLEMLGASGRAQDSSMTESDEFPYWRLTADDPIREDHRPAPPLPSHRKQIVDWLLSHPRPTSPTMDDGWAEFCRHPKQMIQALIALRRLADKCVWPTERWQGALYAWTDDTLAEASGRYAAKTVAIMPQEVFEGAKHAVASWIVGASRWKSTSREATLRICERLLALSPEPASNTIVLPSKQKPKTRPCSRALNEVSGRALRALIHLIFREQPRDGDRLPDDVRAFMEMVVRSNRADHRSGRVILAVNLIGLFRIDREWTERWVLRLLNWAMDEQEAHAAWEGFLWSPRLYGPLMLAIKDDFIETAQRVPSLEEHGKQYVRFLTFAALEGIDGYEKSDFRRAFVSLGEVDLKFQVDSRGQLGEAAQALAEFSKLSEGVDEEGESAEMQARRDAYWENRLKPFWTEIWPQEKRFRNRSVSKSLARLVVGYGDRLPSALELLRPWLLREDDCFGVVHQLDASGACKKYPEAALIFLDATVGDNPECADDLIKCLEKIKKADVLQSKDNRLQRLELIAKRRH